MKKLLISLLLVPFMAVGNDFSFELADTTHVQEDKLGNDRWKGCFDRDACAKRHTDDRDEALLIGKYANQTGLNRNQIMILDYLVFSEGLNGRLGIFNSLLTEFFMKLSLKYREAPEKYQEGVSNVVRGFILEQEKRDPAFIRSGIRGLSRCYR